MVSGEDDRWMKSVSGMRRPFIFKPETREVTGKRRVELGEPGDAASQSDDFLERLPTNVSTKSNFRRCWIACKKLGLLAAMKQISSKSMCIHILM
jgi:hypothetical protein